MWLLLLMWHINYAAGMDRTEAVASARMLGRIRARVSSCEVLGLAHHIKFNETLTLSNENAANSRFGPQLPHPVYADRRVSSLRQHDVLWALHALHTLRDLHSQLAEALILCRHGGHEIGQ